MSQDAWYLARGGRRCGPFLLSQLRTMAQDGTLNPHEMIVQGVGDQWRTAGTEPLLQFVGNASEPDPSAVSPAAATSLDTAEQERQREWERLRQTAQWFRRANLIALAAVGSNLAVFWMQLPQVASVLVGIVASLAILACLVLMSQAMRFFPWIWAVLGLVPFLNLLVLLILANQAYHYLSKRGVEVGFLGASLPAEPGADFVRDSRLGWVLRGF